METDIEHHFRVKDANRYGVNKAILLHNLRFWLKKNKANNKNIHTKDEKDYYWSYNSAEAFGKLFPYMKPRTLSRHLLKLEKDGEILSGTFSGGMFNQTKWYTIPKEFYTENDETISTKSTELVAESGETITDSKQQIVNTDIPMVLESGILVQEEVELPPVKTGQLPEQAGNTPLKRIIKAYARLWKDLYGKEYRPNYGQIGKQYKPLLEELTEYQISALMIMHFNWYGDSGDDEFIHKKLSANLFPMSWIPSKVNEYSIHLTNSLGVDFDKENEVKEYVDDYYNNLKLYE